MKNFKGYTTDGVHSVGCTGQTVYVFDDNGNEIKRFKDIVYAYAPMISPNGKILAVKSTSGKFAFYSLENYSLLKKFSFSKLGAQDDGFCFSPDSKFIINIEHLNQEFVTVITIYNTNDYSIFSRVYLPQNMMIQVIEYDNIVDNYYVLGYILGEKREYDNLYFVAKFDGKKIIDITKINENEYKYYLEYKFIEKFGFNWSELGITSEDIKTKRHNLSKLFNYYNKKSGG